MLPAQKIIMDAPKIKEGTMYTNGASFTIPHKTTKYTRITTRMRVMEQVGGALFGHYGVDDNHDWRFFKYSSIWYFDCGNTRTYQTFTLYNNWFVYDFGYYNGSLRMTIPTSSGTSYTKTQSLPSYDPTPYQIYVGGGNKYLDYVKVYEKDVLVMDIITVKKGSQVGLYDKISKTFMPNIGGAPVFTEK